MESYKCKLCPRTFTNGRALGGHMKAHLTLLPLPPKPHHSPSTSTLFSHSSSSEDEEKQENVEQIESHENYLIYGLREKPKKRLKLADLKFSFSTTSHTEYIVKTKESETESKNPTRKRSILYQKLTLNSEQKKLKQKLINSSSTTLTEAELRSISVTFPEEEAAITLMLLSRDKWNINVVVKEEPQEVERSMEEMKFRKVHGGKHKCEKKIELESHKIICLQNEKLYQDATTSNDHKTFFQCSFCSKVFGSGQALGGHKKCHLYPSKKKKLFFIDLNLPPSPQDDDPIVLYDA